MRKYLPLLLLVSLAACSSSAAIDSSGDESAPIVAPSTSLATVPQNQNNPPQTTIPLFTDVPLDLKSGEGRPLVLEDPKAIGAHQFAVAYANAVVNTATRYLSGAQVDMASLQAAAEFQESTIGVVPNIKERTTTLLGTSGIQIKAEFTNTPEPTFSIAYVCLLDGGAYTSLSACPLS